jgi:P27 family predicted phage terminase small subunit
MAGRGFAPKPPELKVLEGRSSRAIDLTGMFRPEVGLPSLPKNLSAEARKAWKRLTPELLRYNLLATVDADSLAMLCRTIGRVEQLERSIHARQAELAAKGEDVVDALVGFTPKGMRIQSVTYQILNREMDKLRNLLAEFGLTPAQRARVSTAVRVQQSLFDVNGGVPARPAEPAGFAEFD